MDELMNCLDSTTILIRNVSCSFFKVAAVTSLRPGIWSDGAEGQRSREGSSI